MSGYTNNGSTRKLPTYELNNILNDTLKTNMIENEENSFSYPVKKLTLVKTEKERLKKSDTKYVDLSELDANKLEYESENDELIMSVEKKKKVQKNVRSDPVKKPESASKEVQVDLSKKVSQLRLKQKQKLKEMEEEKKKFEMKLLEDKHIKRAVDYMQQ